MVTLEFSKDGMKSVIFCKESSAYDEKWEGPRLGYSEAVEFLGIDESAPLKSLGKDCSGTNQYSIKQRNFNRDAVGLM